MCWTLDLEGSIPPRPRHSPIKIYIICIRLLLCIIIKVLDYYIILEILNNIRLLLNLLLYLGFEPKKNLKKKKTLNENERNTKIFWLLVKKTQIFDPVQFSKYRMVWFFSIAGLIVILVFYQTGVEFHLVCRSNRRFGPFFKTMPKTTKIKK